MLDERIAALAADQHGVIARRQLHRIGLSGSGLTNRVRRHRLFPVVRGVFSLGPHVDIWGLRFAAVLSVGGEPLITGPAITSGRHDPVASVGPLRPRVVVLSHWSALHLFGLIDQAPPRVHVTIEGTGGRPHGGVHVHRARTLHAGDLDVAAGLPVTTPARTILDAARGASVRQVQRLIREAEYRELVAVGAIADVVRRHPFHPGSAIVRKADPETAEAARRHTPIEDRMAAVLALLPLEPPESQIAVSGRSGTSYRADFAWPGLRLIVETDGRTAHQRTTSFQSDRARDADLAAAGWLTLRFTSLQLARADRVAALIRDTALTRPSSPAS